MLYSVWGLAIGFGVVSFGAALAGAAVLAMQYRALMSQRALPASTDPDATIFLVDRAQLVDASPAARDYLAMLSGGQWSYRQLSGHLCKAFPEFQDAMLTLPRRRMQTLTSRDRTQALTLTMEGQRTRIAITTAEKDVVTLDRGSHGHIEAELESLRAMGDSLAFPAWRQSREGAISWANRAYLDLARRAKGADAGIWPPPLLFPAVASANGREIRTQIGTDPETSKWFDCRIESLDDDLFVTAIPADQLIKAEATLADFTQTFSQTFAHLTVGIAVFDRRRQLAMFNPALTDLTNLPVDLLFSRPNLETFLDALRARHMMPEPRDYASWRDHVSDVERAAADGTYSEMWHLPGARTYRVTGRPQIDGAFALLIEDISAEVSLTRRFRSEIETGHHVLNALPDAISVFDRMGNLIMANAAYDALWGTDTQGSAMQMTAIEAVRDWREASAPNAAWGDVQLYLTRDFPEEGWTAKTQLTDGRALIIHLNALPGGMRMVRFSDARRSRLLPLDGRIGEAERAAEARLKA